MGPWSLGGGHYLLRVFACLGCAYNLCMHIRAATEADLPAILAITNDAILHTTALWYNDPLTLENRRQWFLERTSRKFPVLVGELDNQVAAFASFGPFRSAPGYDQTVEHSIYVAPAFHRRGLGTMLLHQLIARASELDLHAMIGCIDASNSPSIDFHKKHGFRTVGLLPQVGKKFNRRLDLLIMQLTFAPVEDAGGDLDLPR